MLDLLDVEGSDVGLMYGEAFEARVAAIPGVQRAQLAESPDVVKNPRRLDVVAAVNLDDAQKGNASTCPLLLVSPK